MWTYSGVPSASEKDEVRFWTQDVDQSRPLLSDEEITFLIDRWYKKIGSLIYVSAIACEVIASKYTSEINVNADGVSVSVGDLQQRYITLAQRLRDTADVEMGDEVAFEMEVMYGSQLSESLEPLVFGIGFMDNWEVGRADYGNYHPGRWTEHSRKHEDELAPTPYEGSEDG